jgi:homoserine/homoserine lactone efflux protein
MLVPAANPVVRLTSVAGIAAGRVRRPHVGYACGLRFALSPGVASAARAGQPSTTAGRASRRARFVYNVRDTLADADPCHRSDPNSVVPDPAILGAFALAAAAIVLSPGPDTMLILRAALGSGRPAGFAAVSGVQLGLAVHTALAAAGVSAVIASSPALFKALALAGAAYLAWLGIQGFRSAGGLAVGAGAPVTPARACRDALLCNVLNPKVIVLFLALYPNFVDAGRGRVAVQVALLSAVLLLINVVWQTALVLGADFARRWLTQPAVQRAIGRLTGVILFGFAAVMVWEHVWGKGA